MKINKRSTEPLYAQLKSLLLERIETGQYQAGDKIPSELVLCKELSLSRPTVRQAIAELVNEGVLQIVKGKGTFVASEQQRIVLKSFNPFTFSLLAAKTLDGFYDLSVSSIKGDPETDQTFQISDGPGHPGYWAVRWHIADEQRVLAVCQSLIPVYMFPELGDDLRSDRRMIDITANKYAYLPQKANAQISVRMPAGREAQQLDIERTVPVMAVSSRLVSRSGKCCEIVQANMRADLITLSMDAGRS